MPDPDKCWAKIDAGQKVPTTNWTAMWTLLSKMAPERQYFQQQHTETWCWPPIGALKTFGEVSCASVLFSVISGLFAACPHWGRLSCDQTFNRSAVLPLCDFGLWACILKQTISTTGKFSKLNEENITLCHIFPTVLSSKRGIFLNSRALKNMFVCMHYLFSDLMTTKIIMITKRLGCSRHWSGPKYMQNL